MELSRAYELLEASPETSDAELKTAYRDLVKVWHPDRFLNDDRLKARAAERLKQINRAYEVVRDARRRAARTAPRSDRGAHTPPPTPPRRSQQQRPPPTPPRRSQQQRQQQERPPIVYACPDCNHAVSEHAHACSRCGCPQAYVQAGRTGYEPPPRPSQPPSPPRHQTNSASWIDAERTAAIRKLFAGATDGMGRPTERLEYGELHRDDRHWVDRYIDERRSEAVYQECRAAIDAEKATRKAWNWGAFIFYASIAFIVLIVHLSKSC